MIDILTALTWLLAGMPTLLLLVFTLEVWLGVGKTGAIDLGLSVPVTCILIPAHNEAKTIAETLERLSPALSNTTKALVVADNCSDDTAALARRQGVEVIERHNVEERGKGYALSFGRDHLRAEPPNCVIVLDADCHSDPGSIIALARYSVGSQLAVQGRNVLDPGHCYSPLVQISNFAFWTKNVVRQRGSCRIGGGAILTGTGMAVPWVLFEQMPLATANIVEDLALTVDLTRSGKAPKFLEQAVIFSPPASGQAAITQRSRWEQGFMAVAASHGFPLLKHGIAMLDRKAILLGLHLLVPPLALLVTSCAIIAAFLAAAALLTSNWYPFAVLGTCLAAALSGVLVNWALEGHLWLKPKTLLFLPIYLAWKLPMYGRFFAGKRVGWVRTERD